MTAGHVESCATLPTSHTDGELWTTRLKWGHVMVGNGSALICRPLNMTVESVHIEVSSNRVIDCEHLRCETRELEVVIRFVLCTPPICILQVRARMHTGVRIFDMLCFIIHIQLQSCEPLLASVLALHNGH